MRKVLVVMLLAALSDAHAEPAPDPCPAWKEWASLHYQAVLQCRNPSPCEKHYQPQAKRNDAQRKIDCGPGSASWGCIKKWEIEHPAPSCDAICAARDAARYCCLAHTWADANGAWQCLDRAATEFPCNRPPVIAPAVCPPGYPIRTNNGKPRP
jgi:hypothetical protein